MSPFQLWAHYDIVTRRSHRARAQFEVIHIKGIHHMLRHVDGRVPTVPVHGTEIIGPGLLSKILRDCDMTRDAFIALL